jgi:hypothetical protein
MDEAVAMQLRAGRAGLSLTDGTKCDNLVQAGMIVSGAFPPRLECGRTVL